MGLWNNVWQALTCTPSEIENKGKLDLHVRIKLINTLIKLDLVDISCYGPQILLCN